MKNKKPKKILIIDDDDMVRGMYVDVFKNDDFEVLESQDGLDGLQSSIANRPDIVFTGIIMPRMDGFTLMQELKKNTITANIPVVISSHLGREEDRKRAEELGAKDFFIKDFDPPKEVLTRVKTLFENEVYEIEFDASALDAPRLAKKLKKENGLTCSRCGKDNIISFRIINLEKGEFLGKLICPECGE